MWDMENEWRRQEETGLISKQLFKKDNEDTMAKKNI